MRQGGNPQKHLAAMELGNAGDGTRWRWRWLSVREEEKCLDQFQSQYLDHVPPESRISELFSLMDGRCQSC